MNEIKDEDNGIIYGVILPIASFAAIFIIIVLISLAIGLDCIMFLTCS